jgi:hypothetical protein
VCLDVQTADAELSGTRVIFASGLRAESHRPVKVWLRCLFAVAGDLDKLDQDTHILDGGAKPQFYNPLKTTKATRMFHRRDFNLGI